MVIGLKDYKRAQAEKARQKRELAKQITELNKQRDELFGKWVFKKSDGRRIFKERSAAGIFGYSQVTSPL